MKGKYGVSMQSIEVNPYRHYHYCRNCENFNRKKGYCTKRQMKKTGKSYQECFSFASNRWKKYEKQKREHRQIADIPSSEWTDKELAAIRKLNAKVERKTS